MGLAASNAERAGKQLRIMFQDEARFGRLPVIRSAWAPPGVRPVVEAAIERQYQYVYGAVSPIEGEIDWMTADSMKTERMTEFLATVRRNHPDDYILMILDGASSHTAKHLEVPDSMQLLKLPPYSPELNPTESLWDHVREKACANTYFKTLECAVSAVVEEIEQLAQDEKKVASMFCWPWILSALAGFCI